MMHLKINVFWEGQSRNECGIIKKTTPLYEWREWDNSHDTYLTICNFPTGSQTHHLMNTV